MESLKKKFPNIQFVDELDVELTGLPTMIKVRHRANKNAAGELRSFSSLEDFRVIAQSSASAFFARFKPLSV